MESEYPQGVELVINTMAEMPQRQFVGHDQSQ